MASNQRVHVRCCRGAVVPLLYGIPSAYYLFSNQYAGTVAHPKMGRP